MARGPSYKAYVRDYKKKAAKLKEKGREMHEPMLSKTDFEYAYKVEVADMKKLVAEGKRAVVGNVTQNLVSKAAYAVSIKQARVLQGAYAKLGIIVTKAEIRSESGDAKKGAALLNKEYHDAVEGGMTYAEAKKHVSKVYFNS